MGWLNAYGRDAQSGSVGRHHAQPVPARRIDPRLGQRQQVPAGEPEELRRKSLPRLAERLRADFPTADRHALQLAKQGIEFGLHAGALGRSGRVRGGTWKTHPAAIGDRVFEFILSIYQ